MMKPYKVGFIAFNLCCAAVMAGTAIYQDVKTFLSEEWSPPPAEYYTHWWCIGSCGAAEDEDSGRFNSRYSRSMTDVVRAVTDKWQIGNHTYATRDLMGRRI